MHDSLAGLVLAAGAGTRLRPLTRLRPKALCPVDGVPLVDRALDRLQRAGLPVAVNVHHGRDQLEAHLQGLAEPPHVSVEAERALGTAGALAHLRGWLSGRAALVVNADTVAEGGLADFVEGWDGERVRVLLAGGGPLVPSSRLVASIVPWASITALEPEPTGLYEHVLDPAHRADQLDVVAYEGLFVDCGTPQQYRRANLLLSGGESVVGDGAIVEGSLVRSVVWPGARVHRAETLVDAIRADNRITVLCR
jgi:NDP-sugar pyrophosphorylase family protein